MKRFIGALIAGGFAASATIAFAQSVVLPEAFGETKDQIILDDARLNAERLFTLIDTDHDGFISEGEYASQAVVRASLSRFNGAVIIEGHATFNISLPSEVKMPIRTVEQTAIDAVARNEFMHLAGEDKALSRHEWIASRLVEFASVDFDENGILTGKELDVYAMNVARYQISLS
ncbi:MAG: hypothetical protein ACWA5L_07645 [bacterium]